MDHGILNVPLSKRGNIDAEIDRYKAAEARTRRAASRQSHADRVAARAALNAASDERLSGLAGKLGLTIKQTRARLRSECISSPRLVLGFLAPEAAA